MYQSGKLLLHENMQQWWSRVCHSQKSLPCSRIPEEIITSLGEHGLTHDISRRSNCSLRRRQGVSVLGTLRWHPTLRVGLRSQSCWSDKATHRGYLAVAPFYSQVRSELWSFMGIVQKLLWACGLLLADDPVCWSGVPPLLLRNDGCMWQESLCPYGDDTWHLAPKESAYMMTAMVGRKRHESKVQKRQQLPCLNPWILSGWLHLPHRNTLFYSNTELHGTLEWSTVTQNWNKIWHATYLYNHWRQAKEFAYWSVDISQGYKFCWCHK